MTDAGPGRLLFEFVRHFSHRARPDGGPVAEQGRLILVTETVAALVERGRPATVNAVADDLGIDQSGASRLLKAGVEVGYLVMAAAPDDGRRREAAPTPAGWAALVDARAWQERVFDELTAGWSRRRREDFRGDLAELLSRSRERDRGERSVASDLTTG